MSWRVTNRVRSGSGSPDRTIGVLAGGQSLADGRAPVFYVGVARRVATGAAGAARRAGRVQAGSRLGARIARTESVEWPDAARARARPPAGACCDRRLSRTIVASAAISAAPAPVRSARCIAVTKAVCAWTDPTLVLADPDAPNGEVGAGDVRRRRSARHRLPGARETSSRRVPGRWPGATSRTLRNRRWRTPGRSGRARCAGSGTRATPSGPSDPARSGASGSTACSARTRFPPLQCRLPAPCD